VTGRLGALCAADAFVPRIRGTFCFAALVATDARLVAGRRVEPTADTAPGGTTIAAPNATDTRIERSLSGRAHMRLPSRIPRSKVAPATVKAAAPVIVSAGRPVVRTRMRTPFQVAGSLTPTRHVG
jgi:hypothetical protein